MAVPGSVQLTAEAVPITKRRPAEVVRTGLLTVAAAGGVLCLACVVAAVGFQLSLVMFRTGSMSPTIPAGSLALVHRIPTADARVGEVVTVDRPGALPVTHRVVSTSVPAGSPSGWARLVLKGDANPTVDAEPYDVGTVRTVLWSAPGLAYVVSWLGHPAVIGALTVAVAGLVAWTFWPAGRRRPPASGPT
ncbi:S26 family signal peptidase [Leifsonia sp. 2TAF2]|uniref:S26 family signal peptidase n=1 Tax=Leifsonia sp. 2TAF2 TaxID=3233009 RepID=UPI003F9C1BFD